MCGEIFSRQPKDVRFEITKGTPPAYGRVIEHVIVHDDRIEVMLGMFTGESLDSDKAMYKTKHKSKRGSTNKRLISQTALVILRGSLDLVTIGLSADEEFAAMWLPTTEEDS